MVPRRTRTVRLCSPAPATASGATGGAQPSLPATGGSQPWWVPLVVLAAVTTVVLRKLASKTCRLPGNDQVDLRGVDAPIANAKVGRDRSDISYRRPLEIDEERMANQ